MKNQKENNILLAEFLGWGAIGKNKYKYKATYPHYISVTEHDYDFRTETEIDIFETAFDDMKFNVDWNWLMLVVDKIESLGYCMTIKLTYCRIHPQGKPNDHIVKFGDGETKLEATYNACVKFVKWYNEQSK